MYLIFKSQNEYQYSFLCSSTVILPAALTSYLCFVCLKDALVEVSVK